MIADQQEDLQRIFDRISDIQLLEVFSRNDVDQQLDEAKVKREKTIESVGQFDEELTSKYTMLESDEQVLTALFSELINASTQGNQVSSIYYDAASFHSSDIYSAISASQAEATSVKKEHTSQQVEASVEENENPFMESVNSFKEIGTDFWAGFQERGEKKMDSLYDFGNYLTSGLFDGVRGAVSAMDDRSDKAIASPYDFVNYLTSGGADLVKGAVNPGDDFSKEHWLSSLGLASMVAGAKLSVPKSGTAKMNSIKHTVHPEANQKVMKQTYRATIKGSLSRTRVNLKEIGRNINSYQLPIEKKLSPAGVGGVNSLIKNTYESSTNNIVNSVSKGNIVARSSERLKIHGEYSTAIDNDVKVIEKANLPEWIGESFKESNYRTVITEKDISLYRTYGGVAKINGSFVTTTPAVNRINAKVNTALLPDWKNSRQYEAVIEVPKGEVLNIGRVAEQNTKTGALLKGDADQVLLPQGWPSEWIKEIREVPSR